MLSQIKTNYLRVPLVLNDLQELKSRDKALSSLTALNKIISSSQKEVEFLYRSDGIQVITEILKGENNLTNICLKILANASRRNAKVRSKLRSDNIFQLVAAKLLTETDFSKSNTILYSALIVMLVHGNREAQILMRSSGCLSSLIDILGCILDEAECKPPPSKSTELVIYAIIVSTKDPRHAENQSELGRITPKVLEYLGKQTVLPDVDQLQVVKCLWLFLKCALDHNENNQRTFLNHSGPSVLFRSIQDVVEGKKCEEMGDLLVKITGVLIKLKSHTDFLSQASHYCPLMILCSLLSTSNNLVVQRVITFLDSLIEEIPHALQIIKDQEILRRIKKAKVMFLRSQMAAEFCENILNRLEISDGTALSENSSLSESLTLAFNTNGPVSQDFGSEMGLLKDRLCIVHDTGEPGTVRNDFSPLFSSLESNEGRHLSRIGPSTAHWPFRRKELRKKEKNLRRTVQQKRFGIGSILTGVFQKFRSFFFADSVDDFRERLAIK